MSTTRLRREPPRFRTVVVLRTQPISPRLLRVTLGGEELGGFSADEPAASVRLLLPRPETDAVVIPTWTGNEFLHEDGTRPTIRTYTPRRVDAGALELDLDVVLHDGGAVPAWLATDPIGTSVGVSGPGRGYAIDEEATGFVLAGDESAIPAISQLLERLPVTATVSVHIEVTRPDARHDLPEHPGTTVVWHELAPGSDPGSTLFDAVRDIPVDPTTRLWVAGEAAAVQRIRRHLFEGRGVPRRQAVVRGYWKVGRGGDIDDA
ncbi:MAG: siderophore-interacting protein [Microthrixaceae bacterium]